MSDGWFCLHRSILEWEWYNDPNTMRLFIHCLVKANYAEKNWKGILIKRGEFITSGEILANELCLTRNQVRLSIKKLKSTNEITSKGRTQHTVISVVNYEKYQRNNQQDDITITKRSPNDNQTITTTNKDNNKTNKQSTTGDPQEDAFDQNKDLLKEFPPKIIDYLNSRTGKKFHHTDTNLKLIRARLDEGFSFEQITKVVDLKINEWLHDEKMKKYLRPATLFNNEKFNQYVGELDNEQIPQPDNQHKNNGNGKGFQSSIIDRATDRSWADGFDINSNIDQLDHDDD